MNLAVTERPIAQDREAPRIFASSLLNKSIILKHTLRPHEQEMFSTLRKVATKIIFPFDYMDLRLGGSSIFLRQREFERSENHLITLTGACGDDLAKLALLDSLPSLDPFLIKEYMNKAGLHVPPERLSLSPSDVNSMQGFVYGEIRKLVSAAFTNFNPSLLEKFSRKILTDTPDESMNPLMYTFKMTEAEFWGGIFSWRGFLYYKWRLENIKSNMGELVAAVTNYNPTHGMDRTILQYIAEARPKIRSKINTAVAYTNGMIEFYDLAYDAMIKHNNPARFKQFLFDGPKLFVNLGEQVGLLDHFTSLWGFRHRDGSGSMSAVEYADFLIDLDESLSSANRSIKRSEIGDALKAP